MAKAWSVLVVAMSCSPAQHDAGDTGSVTHTTTGGGAGGSVSSQGPLTVTGAGGSGASGGSSVGTFGGAPNSSTDQGGTTGVGGSSGGTTGVGGSSGGTPGGTSSGGGGSSGGGASGGSGGVPTMSTCPERSSAALQEALAPAASDGFSVWVKLASEIEATGIPTVGIVRWALEGVVPTEAHIEFGLDSNYGTIAPVQLDCADFRTTLVGLKPERTYHFRIVASDGNTSYVSQDHTLTTGPAPADFPISSIDIPLPQQLDQGFFVGSSWTTISPMEFIWTAYIVDSDGDLVWWYTAEPEVQGGERGFARARLSADSQDVWLVQVRNSGAPLIRVSTDTLELETYDESVGSHDIVAVAGGTMAYVDYSDRDCTGISEIDKAGNVRLVFDITAALGLTGCHANALQYSASQDVYVLSIHQHDVVVVNRDGRVDWKLSEKVNGGNEAWGARQHGVHLFDDGILVFANETEQGSQVLEFALDGSLRRSFPAPNESRFLGNVQRLPSGNALIASGYAMHILDSAGEVVLRANFGLAVGYLGFRSSLYTADE